MSNIEIIFLGTGCMQPTKLRNHAGVILRYKQETILFDCGEGIQRQMRIAGIKPAKITKLCITHWHGDHVFGIPGLMSSMGADQYAKKLEVFGPTGSTKYLKNMFNSFAAKDIIPYTAKDVSSGVIIDDEDFTITVEKLDHSTPCIGFRFQEKDKRRIDTKKAKKLGLEGPILGKIVEGEIVTVNGKKIHPDDVSHIEPGKSVSYVTDTQECDGAHKLAQDVDTLIIEGTLLDNLKANAKKSKHLTVKQAALIASQNNVQKLVITHISQRYKTNSVIAEEAQQYFDDVIVAEDFMKLKL